MDTDRKHPPPGRPVAHEQERPHLEVEAPRGPDSYRAQDHWRVDLDEGWELRFWSREFDCSEEELRKAVQLVGTSAGAVRAYLERGRGE